MEISKVEMHVRSRRKELIFCMIIDNENKQKKKMWKKKWDGAHDLKQKT